MFFNKSFVALVILIFKRIYMKLSSAQLKEILVKSGFVSEQDFEENLNDLPDIDKADQSLIIASRKNPNEKPIILTNDGELLSELIQTKMAGMRLPVFILMLIKWGLVTKNLGAKCLKFWEKVGRFKKKELIRWKNELKMIN